MNSSTAGLRSLIIYAVCVPLAILVGVLMYDPLGYSTVAVIGFLAFILAFPLLVRWHYPLLLLTWSMPCILLFVKGEPNLWLAMGMLTLGISILERALSRDSRFIHVPMVTWPMLCLVGVILFTAKVTGGFGLRALGSDVYGGKKYIFLIAGIISYFALTTRAFPEGTFRWLGVTVNRRNFYVGLFFLGGLTAIIGDLYPIAPRWMEPVFWFFPPTRYEGALELGTTRLVGVGTAGTVLFCYLCCRHGVRGIFLSGSLLRLALFCIAFLSIFLGGFRSGLITIAATFAFQFFLEGLHRTKLLMVFALTGALAVAVMLPVISKMPFTVQRTLAFIPGLELDPMAKGDADASSEWRKEMWVALLPQIPQYLFIGKGYAISMADYQNIGRDSPFAGTKDPSQQSLALSGDYHNGPLSVIIPFGLWGAIAWAWFMIAAFRVLYLNYRYGDEKLRTYNTFLFSYYTVMAVMFVFIGGSMSTDIARLVGVLGLGVCINGGVRRKMPETEPITEPTASPGFLPQPRPSFQR
jgi:hypothetical protein